MKSPGGTEELITKDELSKVAEIFLILEKWQLELEKREEDFLRVSNQLNPCIQDTVNGILDTIEFGVPKGI